MSYFSQVKQTANFIADKLFLQPKNTPNTAVVLGSGLSQFADELKDNKKSSCLSFSEIPGFINSGVSGHAGELILGYLEDNPVFALNGRIHLYEGYSPLDVVLPIRALGVLGIKNIILTNASGAIREDFDAGQIMLIDDHINLTGTSSLLGKNINELGPRFVDMTKAYDEELISLAKDISIKENIPLNIGVYAGLLGPTYETPAEVRMLNKLGADAVGMSTVLETIAARHMGIRVLAFSCLTNKAAGLKEQKISHEEVLDINIKAGKKLSLLIKEILSKL